MKKLVEEKENELIQINQTNKDKNINLIFRNQKNEDINIPFNIESLNSVERLREGLKDKLQSDKNEVIDVRMFFKGKPLNEDMQISSLSTNN